MASVPWSPSHPAVARSRSLSMVTQGRARSDTDSLVIQESNHSDDGCGGPGSPKLELSDFPVQLDKAARGAVSSLRQAVGYVWSSAGNSRPMSPDDSLASLLSSRGSDSHLAVRRARSILLHELRQQHVLANVRQHKFSPLRVLLYILRLSLRSGAAAWAVKATVTVMLALARGGGLRAVLRALTARDTARFGLFMGLLVAISTSTRYGLRVLRGKADWVNDFAAGAVGGLAMLADSKSRRPGLALFVMVRAAYVAVHTAMRMNMLQRRNSAVFWLFALANMPIIYATCLEPHLLEAGYRAWIFKIGKIEPSVMAELVREPYFGIGADTLPALYSLAAAMGVQGGSGNPTAAAARAIAGSTAASGATASALTDHAITPGIGRSLRRDLPAVPSWLGGAAGVEGALPPAAADTAGNTAQRIAQGKQVQGLPWLLRWVLRGVLGSPATSASLDAVGRRTQASTALAGLRAQQYQRTATMGAAERAQEQLGSLVGDPAACTARLLRQTASEAAMRTEQWYPGAPAETQAAMRAALQQLPAGQVAAVITDPGVLSTPAVHAALSALQPGACSHVRQRTAHVPSASALMGGAPATQQVAVLDVGVEIPPALKQVSPADLFPGVRVGPPFYRSCQHSWHGGRSCLVDHMADIPRAMKDSARMYAPIHLVPLLLFRWRQVCQAPVAALRRTAGAIFRSSAFLTTYLECVRAGTCALRQMTGHDHWSHSIILGPAAALGLYFESPKRNSELMLYCAIRGLDVVWQLLERSGWVCRVPHGDVALFSLSMAVLLSTPRSDFKPTYRTVLNFVFGTNKDAKSLVQAPPAELLDMDTPQLAAQPTPPSTSWMPPLHEMLPTAHE